MSLRVATAGDQGQTLPVVLGVAYVEQRQPEDALKTIFEDKADLSTSGAQKLVTLQNSDGSNVDGSIQILQHIHEHVLKPKFGGQTNNEREWISRAFDLTSPDFRKLEGPLFELDSHLILRTHVVGYSINIADLAVWGALRGNRVTHAYVKKNHLVNLGRWFRYVEENHPWIAKAVGELYASAREKKDIQSRAGASYEIALPDTEKGVVTRFPPEPSGYLHIGHAKAALLNDYFAHEKYKGTLLLRFDDTNPSKEKEEFQESIIQDLALMGITPDKFSHTSDYFTELYDYGVRMVKDGNAYADDTDQATMQDQRWNGLPSARRNRPVEESLAIFEQMKLGTDLGMTNCIRAKISVDNPNKAMRDPVIYRSNHIPHHRTGSTWKTYPTYDFCCPIVDSMEGVTHALRTNEYRDRNPQYEWMLDALGLRKVHIWDFARMNLTRTLLSKRKLTKFVDQGTVWGWDDPRFPTIRGIRRRGMTIPALREFILKQGPSRNVVNLDWTIFWATNRKYIDPVAPRYTAISSESAVKVKILNGPAKPYSEDKPCHGKNPDLGKKQVGYSQNILVEQADAQSFAQDEEITLMNWGNAFVRKISASMNPLSSTILTIEMELHLEGDVKKTEKKITWLSEESRTRDPIELVDFDFLITKDKLEEGDEVENFLNPKTEFRSEAISDGNVAKLARDAIIQFERKGYYRVDQPAGPSQRAVLFQIPTGKTKGGI